MKVLHLPRLPMTTELAACLWKLSSTQDTALANRLLYSLCFIPLAPLYIERRWRDLASSEAANEISFTLSSSHHG